MKTVYLAQKNADMTEGRGPMITDKAFSRKEDAEAYIDYLPGIFGTKPPEGGWSSRPHNGHWEVEELTVFESLGELEKESEEKAYKSAMKKLSTSEIEAIKKKFGVTR